jgi:Cu2+-exporting ATPase
MRAEKVGQDTLLAKIITMVHDASRSRAPIQKLVDKISHFFVPAVIVIAVITFIAWVLFGGEQRFEYAWANALAVLIVACPCALGLATPMSVMVGVGEGAKNGILIKNAEALENLSKIKVLIIDKTGTITEGKPGLQAVVSVGNYSEQELLILAASLNQYSEHPLAEAIVKKGLEKKLPITAVAQFAAVSGKGVTGIAGRKNVAIGNDRLMNDVNATITPGTKKEVMGQQAQGRTVSYIAINNNIEGYLIIYDAIKTSSKEAIQKLLKKGIDVVMLTGDNEVTAKAVANELGLHHYKAQCLPQDKLEEIKRLQAAGNVVGMAGDGINDAPALAASDIGIAMGTGSDAAIESAGLTLVKGDLVAIVKAMNLSHKVIRNIRQNLFFAFIYNVIGIPIAAGILFSAFGILMSPMIAAAAMSLSSVSVILNSLRLRNTMPEKNMQPIEAAHLPAMDKNDLI